MTNQDKSERGGDGGFYKGMIVGGLFGFVIGMIMAPKSGDETRAMFSERSQEFRDKAEEFIAAARERMSSVGTEGRKDGRNTRADYPFEGMDLDDEDL